MIPNKFAVLGVCSACILLVLIIVCLRDEQHVKTMTGKLQQLIEKEQPQAENKVKTVPETTRNFISGNELREFRHGGSAISPSDPILIKYIRKQMIGPSKEPLTLFLSQDIDQSQVGQSKKVDEILKHRTNGFYVECGAASGEARSNSLFFERARSWNGLLIEADPQAYNALLRRNRHAYSLNACLSPKNETKEMHFEVAGELGGLDSEDRAGPSKGNANSAIQCFPIDSVLHALDIKHIDYFSLDVEGLEVAILNTFPWDTVTVDVWTVEYRTFNNSQMSPSLTKERYDDIKNVFDATGLYKQAGTLPTPKKGEDPVYSCLDVVYKRKKLVGGH